MRDFSCYPTSIHTEAMSVFPEYFEEAPDHRLVQNRPDLLRT